MKKALKPLLFNTIKIAGAAIPSIFLATIFGNLRKLPQKQYRRRTSGTLLQNPKRYERKTPSDKSKGV